MCLISKSFTNNMNKMFKLGRPLVIGMIHAQALPGTPGNRLNITDIIKAACEEAEVYKKCRVDAVLVENMHDLPYLPAHQLGPEVTAALTALCAAVRSVLPPSMPSGVQVLAGGNQQALAIALAAGLDFIRAEGFVFSHVADEGLMNACAGELLRYRKHIGATDVLVFTDIKKKHCAHSITQDISIVETAKAAEFFMSDGLVITGSATGDPASPSDVADVKNVANLPVIVGSGVTAENLHQYLNSSGFIVGSYFKESGRWENKVCEERVAGFMKKLNELTSCRNE